MEERYMRNLQAPSTHVGSKRVHAEQDSETSEPPLKRRRGGEVGRDWPCPRNDCDKAFKSVSTYLNSITTIHHFQPQLTEKGPKGPHTSQPRGIAQLSLP
jgi:hypothetical protein